MAALPPDVAFVERYAQQELSRLGYSADGRRLSARGRVRFVVIDWPINRAATAAHDVVGHGVKRRLERG
jgi:hypothetical protein